MEVRLAFGQRAAGKVQVEVKTRLRDNRHEWEYNWSAFGR